MIELQTWYKCQYFKICFLISANQIQNKSTTQTIFIFKFWFSFRHNFRYRFYIFWIRTIKYRTKYTISIMILSNKIKLINSWTLFKRNKMRVKRTKMTIVFICFWFFYTFFFLSSKIVILIYATIIEKNRLKILISIFIFTTFDQRKHINIKLRTWLNEWFLRFVVTKNAAEWRQNLSIWLLIMLWKWQWIRKILFIQQKTISSTNANLRIRYKYRKFKDLKTNRTYHEQNWWIDVCEK